MGEAETAALAAGGRIMTGKLTIAQREELAEIWRLIRGLELSPVDLDVEAVAVGVQLVSERWAAFVKGRSSPPPRQPPLN
jgi:hypothetical protein